MGLEGPVALNQDFSRLDPVQLIRQTIRPVTLGAKYGAILGFFATITARNGGVFPGERDVSRRNSHPLLQTIGPYSKAGFLGVAVSTIGFARAASANELVQVMGRSSLLWGVPGLGMGMGLVVYDLCRDIRRFINGKPVISYGSTCINLSISDSLKTVSQFWSKEKYQAHRLRLRTNCFEVLSQL